MVEATATARWRISPAEFRRPEWVFLLIFLIFGTYCVAAIPLGWNADEPNHTYRATQIAGGAVLPEVRTGPDGQPSSGGAVPEELAAVFAATGTIASQVFEFSVKAEVGQPAGASVFGGSDFRPTSYLDFRNTAIYSPVAYLPQLPAIWVGGALDWSWSTILYAARVLGLLVVAAATFFAIRITPVGKWVFLAVGLLPSFVNQSSSISADVSVLACAALFAALVLRALADPDPPTAGRWVLLIAVGAALGMTKVAYGPAVVLLLAVPMVHRSGRGLLRWGIAAGAVVLSLVPTAVWFVLTSSAAITINPANDKTAQLAGMLANPIGFVEVIYRTFFTNDLPGMYTGLFGHFVWATAALPTIYILLAVGALALSTVAADERESFLPTGGRVAVAVRSWWVVVAVGVATVNAAAVYVAFTATADPVVTGFQGRYLLPSVLLGLVAVAGGGAMRGRAVRIAVVTMSVLALVGAVLEIQLRLY